MVLVTTDLKLTTGVLLAFPQSL